MDNFSCNCPSCGAPIKWNAEKEAMYCEFCDQTYSPENSHPQTKEDTITTKKIQYEHGKSVQSGRKSDDETEYSRLVIYHCKNCGAELVTSKVTSASSCLYCGSSVMIGEQLTGRYAPHYILPFSLSKEQALEAFRKHIKSPYTPKKFQNAVEIDKIQGIYLPYWLFSGRCHAEGTYLSQDKSSNNSNSQKAVLYTRDYIYPFTRVPADASTQTPDEITQSLEPYNLTQMKPFQIDYLAGFLAERYDTGKTEVSQIAGYRISNSVREKMIKSCPEKLFVVEHKYKQSLSVEDIEYALLPAWMVHCSYKNKHYLFAMNGQTGKFAGNVPVSRLKARLISFGVYAAAMLLTVIFYFIKQGLSL